MPPAIAARKSLGAAVEGAAVEGAAVEGAAVAPSLPERVSPERAFPELAFLELEVEEFILGSDEDKGDQAGDPGRETRGDNRKPALLGQ